MILLNINNFSGIFRIDSNPALIQEINRFVRTLEDRVLRYLFGNYWADFIINNTTGILAQSVLNSRRHLYYSYEQSMLDYVLNYKLHVGLRGNQNEDVYNKIPSINSVSVISRMNQFMRIMKSFYDKQFVVGSGGVLDLSLEIYYTFQSQDLEVIPFDVGFEFFDDSNNIYTISSVFILPNNVYRYTFSPNPTPGQVLYLRNIFKPLPKFDFFV